MPKETKVTCDNCGKDLTSTGNCQDWRIALVNDRIPSRGGVVTAMASSPCLKHNLYFCGLDCLKQYFDWK